MAISLIQTATLNGGSAASVSFTVTVTTPKNLGFLCMRLPFGSGVTVNVTDTGSSTWNAIAGATFINGSDQGCAFYATLNAAGNNMITVHFTGGTAFWRIVYAEYYAGVGVTSWTNTSSNKSVATTASPNSGNITDLSTDLVLGYLCNNAADGILFTGAVGWTLVSSVNTSNPGLYVKASPTGTDAFSGTTTSEPWGIAAMNLRPMFQSTGLPSSIYC